MDVIGETETIGKSVGSDEKNQKATYVVFEGLEKAKQEVADLTRRCDRYFTRTSIRKSIFDRTFTMDGASR